MPTTPVSQVCSAALSHVQTWRRIPTIHKPLVAVIGVGFVGSGLIERFSSVYRVIGYDISKSRVIEAKEIFKNNINVHVTGRDSDLMGATLFLLSVPTLLREDQSVDLSYLKKALITVQNYARAGSTVVIESSVAVGHTRLLLGPLLRSHSLFGGMSPEVSSCHLLLDNCFVFHCPLNVSK
jgi:UDP-N-acetyl-D-mannosaminuronate dehydrogenase